MKYDSYKSSGIEWIGDVPSHWDILKIGQVFKERKEKVSDKDFAPLSVTKNGIVPQLESAAKSNAGDDRKKVVQGDFVINSRSDRKGSSGVSPLDGSVSLISIILEPKNLYGDYIHNLFRSYDFTEEFYKNGQGIVADLWSTKYSLMKSIYIPIPPKDEQKAIADFLDKKLESINSYILKQKELIELLKEKKSSLINRAVTRGLDNSVKYKQSGVEWIGEMPKHWEAVKIKRMCSVKRGASPRPIDDPRYFDENGEYSWVRIADVTKSEKYLYKTAQKMSREGSLKSVKIEPNKIFLSIAGSVGKPIISKIKCCIHDGFVWFDRLEKNIDINFLYYIFLNGEAYKGLGKLGTQLNLNTDTVGMISIPMMKIEEQKQIVNYIEKESKKIDDVISNIEEELKLLDEYKQSIISSAVTGKIKVV